MTPILQFNVRTDLLGNPLKPGGFIGMQRVVFNREDWTAGNALGHVVLIEGYDLVIRRSSYNIVQILRGTPSEMTMIYTDKDNKFLADKMVTQTEKDTGKKLDDAEKERIWKLVVGSAQS